jgi:hypothetical protein
MAYENYENNIIATYANDVARGVIDPINYDLKSKKAKRKYQEYINKIIKMKPREYFVDSFPETANTEEFFKIAYYLVLQIFGKDFIPEFSDLVQYKLYINNSREIFEGISLQFMEKDNLNVVKRALEIPDFTHISSIITLLHEYTHYHCQLLNMDFNKKRYYEEILSIYVEKRATDLLSTILSNPHIYQMVTETRLEGLVWHYDTHEKEMQDFLQELKEIEKLAKTSLFHRLQLISFQQQLPWIKTKESLQLEENYRSDMAASYGIGFLYSESLFVRYKEDEKRTNAKVGDTLRGYLKLQDLLDYFGINAQNDEMYQNVNKTLEKVRKSR